MGGCKTLRLDKVIEHERSVYHAEAVNIEADSLSHTLQAQAAVMESKEVKTVIAALKIVKCHIPHTTNYKAFVELAIKLGCEELKDLNVGANASYTSEEIIQEFIAIILQVTEEDTLKELKGSPTFSLMVDESTDISVLKQLVIFGKMLIDDKPRTHFLKVTEPFDGNYFQVRQTVQ